MRARTLQLAVEGRPRAAGREPVLHAAHRRITDARARMSAQWRIPDGLSWGAEGQLMTRLGHSALIDSLTRPP